MTDLEKVYLLISEHLDEDFDNDFFSELEEFFEESRQCQCYYNTLRRTVQMCHEIDMEEVPEEVHQELLRVIRIEFIMHPQKERHSR